ncbi:hypothetical protein BD309DRAFT_737511 [Dichomitus squalens]|nr:hypothetical protein BD309DRAFT_737511 [Dichomitus squalens]
MVVDRQHRLLSSAIEASPLIDALTLCLDASLAAHHLFVVPFPVSPFPVSVPDSPCVVSLVSPSFQVRVCQQLPSPSIYNKQSHTYGSVSALFYRPRFHIPHRYVSSQESTPAHRIQLLYSGLVFPISLDLRPHFRLDSLAISASIPYAPRIHFLVPRIPIINPDLHLYTLESALPPRSPSLIEDGSRQSTTTTLLDHGGLPLIDVLTPTPPLVCLDASLASHRLLVLPFPCLRL